MTSPPWLNFMRIGYNTNGMAFHDGVDAIQILAEIGFQSVALTVDHHLLNPKAPWRDAQGATVRRMIGELKLHTVIESGARYLLDPRIKHHPTLLSLERRDRARRIEFLKYCVELAAELGSDCVSIWSGAKPRECGESQAWDLLARSLDELLDFALEHRIPLAFEPEPDMFVDTMAGFARLRQQLHRDDLMLTLDIGHLHCMGEVPIADHVVEWKDLIRNVHIEDMKRGRHEHLMFGEGEIDFPPVIRSLRQISYGGGVHVELSRHSHDGPRVAQQAFDFLDPLIRSPGDA